MRWVAILACTMTACGAQEGSTRYGSGVPEKDLLPERVSLVRIVRDVREWAVGSSCGLGGGPAPGRLEIDGYMANHDVEKLRELLREPQPAARVYAAIALRQLGAMTESEFQRRIFSITDGVEVCAGCIFSRVAAVEAVGYY